MEAVPSRNETQYKADYQPKRTKVCDKTNDKLQRMLISQSLQIHVYIPIGYGFSWNSCPAAPNRSNRPCSRLSRPVYQ